MRDMPVRNLQRMLRTIASIQPGLGQVIPDGIYGKNTRLAVTQLQRQSNLPATGVTDFDTWNTVVSLYRDALGEIAALQTLELTLQPGQVISPGEENLHLHLVQAMLTVIGKTFQQVPRVPVNGINEENTAGALRWLQRLSDLPETGELNRPTWRTLVGLYRATAGDGKILP